MMHYLTYVFIPRGADIEDAVADAMRPFGAELEVKPWKRYLDEGEIAAMAKCYRVRKNDLNRLAQMIEDWNGGKGGVDRKGLYAMLSYNRSAKWDWYEVGGRWNGKIPSNVTTARSLSPSLGLKRLLPHDFLTPDGNWHEKSRLVCHGWLDWHFVNKSESRWVREFKRALAEYPAHKVVCVDRHF